MNVARKFVVVASLPERLRPLLEIAHNLWWTWNPEAIALFQRVDQDRWEEVRHNPLELLGSVGQERLEALAGDEVFLSHLDRVQVELARYMGFTTWHARIHGETFQGGIAYFSAEFGLHECLPIYSGGLGILAGDHLKSASELGLPLAGIGLLYRHGYFRQRLNRDGWQQEETPENDFYNMPISLVLRPDGSPQVVAVEYPGRIVRARIWRVQVGRVPLFLLDARVDENAPADREITAQLYGGDLEMRIKQEILLGIGGVRALDALGIPATVCHMNEGHSAFLAIERIRSLMRRTGLGFDEARELTVATNVFTTHTPVPAGIDEFPADLVRPYLAPFAREMGIPGEQLIDLGRRRPGDSSQPLCMAVLALRLAAHSNGVSELHARVSRSMWREIWPGVPEDEIPIGHVTNGIHTPSWYSDEIARLYDRYLGPRWQEDPVDRRVWERVAEIPDFELWRCRERLRERLVTYSRRRLGEWRARHGEGPAARRGVEDVLDPEVLTIGFARRMATYKRATLIFRDLERLARILNDPERSVQIIFAGKAHPRDQAGKELIRRIFHIASDPVFRRRIAFLEDYDIEVARQIVQGVDIWLNTPRRPMEASGTSGMKAAVNGALNVSILDGWWCEGYRGDNGFAIGAGEEYDDPDAQDEIESQLIYDLLEREIVPLFYDRGGDGLPRGWVARMKASMRSICPAFNTNRMLEEYTERSYLPCMLQWNWLSADGGAAARSLAAWRRSIQEHWGSVRIVSLDLEDRSRFAVGEGAAVRAEVALGAIPPDMVSVEVYCGSIDPAGGIRNGRAVVLAYDGPGAPSLHRFSGVIPCERTGEHGLTARVLPRHQGLGNRFASGLIRWFS